MVVQSERGGEGPYKLAIRVKSLLPAGDVLIKPSSVGICGATEIFGRFQCYSALITYHEGVGGGGLPEIRQTGRQVIAECLFTAVSHNAESVDIICVLTTRWWV